MLTPTGYATSESGNGGRLGVNGNAGFVSAALPWSEPMGGPGLSSTGRDGPEGAIEWFECRDVFAARSPVLPVQELLKLVHVASDLDG